MAHDDRDAGPRPILEAAAPFLAAALTACAAVADMAREVVEAHNALVVDAQTPHTRWARPCALGRVRALFLVKLNADVNVGPARIAVDLAQRFDIAPEAVLVSTGKGTAYAIAYPGGSGVLGGRAGEQRLAELLQRPYDCYVVTGPVMGHLPDSARDTIMAHVGGGGGLALLYEPDEKDQPLLAGATALDHLPRMLADLPGTRAFQVGKGRAVVCAVPGWNTISRTPASVFPQALVYGLDLPRDLRAEQQGRALLWAAGREPEVAMTLSIERTEIPRDALAGHAITVAWRGGAPGRAMRLETRVRAANRRGRTLAPVEGLTTAEGTWSTPVPDLPAGAYVAEAIAHSDRGIEAWAVKPFAVSSDERVGPVTLDRDWATPGEPIAGRVAVDSPRRDRRTLRLQILDRHGRALVRRDVRGPAASVAFALPTTARMPSCVGVEAVLMDGEAEVASACAERPCTLPQRRLDDWHFVLWGPLYSALDSDIAEDTLARCGITSRTETNSVPFWTMTRAGMGYVPYCTSGLQRQRWNEEGRLDSIALDPGGVLEGGCWNDEPAVTERLDAWLGAEEDYRRHGVLAYSMGDEHETMGSCLHPACMDRYREYLKGEYGTVAALNDSWGSAFAGFAEVTLSAPDDNHEKSALAAGNHARWFDRRAFQAWNYATYCRRFGDAARRMDPGAIAGAEGAGWLDDDLDLIVRHTGWMILYSIPAAEVIRSIAPRDYLYGTWTSYSLAIADPKYPLSDFWLGFLRGANCMGWWRVDSFLSADYGGPAPAAAREVVETGRIVFDGLGRLLNVESQMQHDGIAMLHSFASAQAASHLEAGPTYGTYSGWVTNCEAESARGVDWALGPRGKNHFAWHRAIRAAGLQFEYVTDRMLRLGAFRPDPYKVLVLSQCEAIGPAEAAAIRRFVADGGTVIADVRPGLYDGHCKRLDGGALDDLFGVRHTGNVDAVTTGGRIDGVIGGTDVSLELTDLDVNPAVELTTGSALGRAGRTPICIVNAAGAGRAVLLNFTMCTYPNLSLPRTGEGAADFLEALFASAGVTWPLRLLDEGGRRQRDREVVRWRTGPGIAVAAVYGPLNDNRAQWRPMDGRSSERSRARDVPEAVAVRLPRERWVSVIGTQGPIGRTRRFTIQSRPWRPVFFVSSDAPLAPPVLEVVDAEAARGGVVSLMVRIPDARGRHAVKLQVTGPDGTDAPWFARRITVSDGRALVDLPVAHNEGGGTWQATVTDLYTDATASAAFTVDD